jgi:hypothetical protein
MIRKRTKEDLLDPINQRFANSLIRVAKRVKSAKKLTTELKNSTIQINIRLSFVRLFLIKQLSVSTVTIARSHIQNQRFRLS